MLHALVPTFSDLQHLQEWSRTLLWTAVCLWLVFYLTARGLDALEDRRNRSHR